MTDLSASLENWLNDVHHAVLLTPDEKGKVTGAGAEVFAKILKKNTPYSSRNYNHPRRAGRGRKSGGGRQTKHLRDAITFKPGFTSDHIHTGATSVGWEDGYTAMVARFVNNGLSVNSSKQIHNMHFKERSEAEARNSVLQANAEAYRRLKHQ